MLFEYKQRDICPHDEFCGGCIYQGISYDEQLAKKEGQVLELIENKKIDIKKLEKIEPAPKIYEYRNKMEYTFGDMVKGGETTLGMHQKGRFMSIVTVDKCQLVHSDFNIVLREVLDFVVKNGYKHYHKKSHQGMVRNLILRRGIRTNELLINIVTTSDTADAIFDEKGFVDMLHKLDLGHDIVGILRTINDNKADAVKCEELKILEGRDYYMENIMGLQFKVSAFSFFQTNIYAIERLYQDALNLIDDFEGKKVFDLFCGTGTITQSLALKAKEVVGVEIVETAVDAAKANAQLNGLDNCKFITGDVFKVLDTLEDKPEVIVVDPPRVGIEPKALDKIISYGVNQIVYISCNPKTLVENLYYLTYNGYDIDYLKPYDNFCFTKHCECVALLTKRKNI